MDDKEKKIYSAAKDVSLEGNYDVVLLNSDIERGIDNKFIIQLRKRRKNKNLLLILVTPGGNADAAYRIARCAQENYDKFIVFVPGYCKSAGTLCVLGAHGIVMSDQGELGPLDVQVYKPDELGELSSGLVIGEALGKLRQHAFEMFEDYFLSIKQKSGGQVTLKTATDTAAKLVIGLFEPVYCQIDPSAIGDIARSMTIAKDYGARLQVSSKNSTPETLDALVRSYSSHGFVIDRREAETLFDDVQKPTEKQELLARLLAPLSRSPSNETILKFLYPNTEIEELLKENHDEGTSDEGSAKPDSAALDDKVGAGGDGSNLGTPSGAPAKTAQTRAVHSKRKTAAGRT